MRRAWWRRARLGGCLALLVALLWRVGGGPFLEGIRAVDGWALALAPCGASRWAAVLRSARCDLRHGLLATQTWPGVVVASVAAVTGHVATFLVAARAAGATASLVELLPLVLLAMAVPLNVAGWGPREGAAAWAFGAAGLGAGQEVATAVVYGVLVLAAGLPGAVVLLTATPRQVAHD